MAKINITLTDDSERALNKVGVYADEHGVKLKSKEAKINFVLSTFEKWLHLIQSKKAS